MSFFYKDVSKELYEETSKVLDFHGIEFASLWERTYPPAARFVPIISFEGPLRQSVIDAIFIIDVRTMCLFAAFWSFFHSMRIEDGEAAKRHAAMLTTFKMYTDILAYRKLFFSSLPEQANTLARTISHCSDAVILALIDNEFATEFLAVQSDDEANHIWYKYLSKNKAKKSLAAYLDAEGEDSRNKGFIQWDKVAERELGTSVHSAKQSCVNAFYSYLKFPSGDKDNPADYYEWQSARSLPFVEVTLYKTTISVTKIIEDNPSLIHSKEIPEKAKMMKEYIRTFDAMRDLADLFESKSRENMELFLTNTFSNTDLSGNKND